jgi:hypothetical protein
MTKTDQASETPCISNIPDAGNIVTHIVRVNESTDFTNLTETPL